MKFKPAEADRNNLLYHLSQKRCNLWKGHLPASFGFTRRPEPGRITAHKPTRGAPGAIGDSSPSFAIRQNNCRFPTGIFVIGVDVRLTKWEEENSDATVCALATQ